MRTLRTSKGLRGIIWVVAMAMAWLQVSPVYAAAHQQEKRNAQLARWQYARSHRSELPAGLTQTPDAALQKKIAAKEAAARAAAAQPVADVRPLSLKEMQAARGRGAYRNPYFNGTLPWQKSFRDVNMCNGNLFKSFTDMQIAPARGAGLVLQRTYNSNDARIGPFGVGWTHAYDIRMEEAKDVEQQSGNSSIDQSADDVPRTDFFGAKHTYHRDADGLYSPPPYLFDETSSDYDTFLASGPTKVLSDTEKGMDGTIKHYISTVTLADGTSGNERACDYIQDRHGNTTVLTYGQTIMQPDGSARKLLTKVTDPSGRSLTFTWNNFGTTAQPAYRIVEVDAPTDPATGLPVYKVTYGYYTNASDPTSYLNLHTVTLDPGGLARTTTYAYTGYTGGYYAGGVRQYATENGLLASVSDPLGHTVSYCYEGPTIDATTGAYSASPTNTVWVDQITEPGGVDAGGGVRTQVWTMSISGDLQTHGEESYVRGPTATGPISFHTMSGGSGGPLNTTTVACEQGDTTGTLMFLTYDANNNLTQTRAWSSDSHPEFGQALHWTDDYQYGQHGNQRTHQAETRDAVGGVAYFPGTDTTAYFDASKYFAKQAVTDRNGHTTAMDYFSGQDAAPGNRGEVAWVRDAGYGVVGSPSQGKEFDYTYNQYGQKATETNLNGVVTQYTYGTSGTDLGNLVQVVQDPGAGHLNRTTVMHYDVMGRVRQSVDPKGQESDFTYNTLGQPLTVKSYSDAGLTLKETVSYTYGANGRMDSVTDNRGTASSAYTTSMQYEAGCDRVASVTDPQTGTTGYTYGLAGERRSVTLPGGGTWTYDYTLPATAGTNAGRQIVCLPGFDPDKATLLLTGVTDDAGRRVDVQMDLVGGLHAVRFDQAYDGTGALASYAEQELSYDTDAGGFSQRRLTAERTTWHWKDTSGAYPVWRARLVSENDYTYDSAGQRLTNAVTAMTPGVGGAPQYTGGSPAYSSSSYTDPLGPSYYAVTNLVQTARTEQYGYDANNRLTGVDYGDGGSQSYTFDALGNRLSKTDSAAGGSSSTTTYGYNAANMLLGTALNGGSASAYANDADGNTLTGGGRVNTWDSQNRLVQSIVNGTASTFKYGADGLRRQMTVTPAGGGTATTTDYCLDGQSVVREMQRNSQGVLTPTATYLNGPRGPEYKRSDLDGTVRWYVYDGLGSVVGEVDPNGNLTASTGYDVYGAKRGGLGSATSRHGFVGSLGHQTDAETGLVYMRARYYDPNVGRFISEDPAQHGLNWFAYCGDNPINRVDANGKVDWPVIPSTEIPPVPNPQFGPYSFSGGLTEEQGSQLLLEFEEFSEMGNPAHWHAKLAEKALEALEDFTASGGEETSGEAAEFNLEVLDQLSEVSQRAGLGAQATETSDEVAAIE